MSKLTNEQKKANEAFFLQVIRNLTEGGVYCFPAQMAIYTKRNHKLVSDIDSVSKVAPLVTSKFFQEHFDVLE